MNMNEPLLAELDHELAQTRKTLERIPADKFDFKPHAKSGTMIWLAHHIAGICDWGFTTLTTPSLTMENYTEPANPTTNEDLVAAFDKSAAQYREALAKASNEDLMAVWTMTWQGNEMIKMPRIAVLRGMIMNHLIHHRGQLTMYMRMCDIAVPGMYGPSADEKQFGESANA
ncbi:MAG: DinB family protein [Bryobacteraceae bacterium]|nr:DinB family protein [Bryobacteraceae bacterium]